MPTVSGRDTGELLRALASELERAGSVPMGLCVIGGAALAVLGLVDRPTKDIDVVALGDASSGTLVVRKSKPLPETLVAAVRAVATQYGIEASWLNAGPGDLVDWGLPAGFEERLQAVDYGPALRVHYAGRLDQVCFKTYAAADVAGRHLTDLISLTPAPAEMDFAFRWAVSQDPSQGFRTRLEGLADYPGVRDVLDRIEG